MELEKHFVKWYIDISNHFASMTSPLSKKCGLEVRKFSKSTYATLALEGANHVKTNDRFHYVRWEDIKPKKKEDYDRELSIVRRVHITARDVVAIPKYQKQVNSRGIDCWDGSRWIAIHGCGHRCAEG